MDTQPQPQGIRHNPTVVMIVGGAIMLFALAGPLAFYFWGQIPPSGGGEQWNDLIADVFIVFTCLPTFIIGLVLLLIGANGGVRSYSNPYGYCGKKSLPSTNYGANASSQDMICFTQWATLFCTSHDKKGILGE